MNAIYRAILLFALLVAVVWAEDAPRKFPVNFDLDFGGITPVQGSGQYYSGSFMIGTGANLAVKKWFTWDIINADFGFGTGGKSRTIQLTNGETRSTANVQTMLGTGGRLNLPFGEKGRLSFGGGAAGIFQREYGVGRTTYVGATQINEVITCRDCFKTTYNGYYVLLEVASRDKTGRGVGLFCKYFQGLDDGKSYVPYGYNPPEQHWLSVGLNFSFGW